MVLNAFDLTGKVAIVTGCDTGPTGMTLGLRRPVRYRRHQP